MKPSKSLQFAALALCAFTAQADEVILKNGDKISGVILSKAGKALEMKTEYAEKVVIKWDAVETISSDRPLSITLKDKQELTGMAAAGQGGTMTLKSNGVYDSHPIPVTEIAEINKKFFSGSANFGGGLSGGNTERQNYHADANAVVRGRDDKVSLGGQYNYGDNTDTASKVTTLNARNWQLYGNYAHYFTPRWYGYAHGLFTNDRMQDIRLRSAFGVGAGYQFFGSGSADDDLNLSLEAGPDYVNLDFYDTAFDCSANLPGGRNNVNNPNACDKLSDRSGIAGRWAVNYDQWLWDRVVQVFHTHEGLVSDDLFIRSRTGFRVPIWNGIQFTNEIQVDYLSKPAPGKENVDTRYLFNVGYAW